MDNTYSLRSSLSIIVTVTTYAIVTMIANLFSGLFARIDTQSSAYVNSCGNDELPTDTFCQSTDSDILGDENVINILGLQTGGAAREQTPVPVKLIYNIDTRLF